jgi:hypothetical protein
MSQTHFETQGHVYPELTKKTTEIKEILDEEEESFSRTLDRGEKLFEQYATAARETGSKELNGKDVWRLYDTYGFPVDLTRLMAEELGLGINGEEFEAAQAASREASKASLKVGAKDVVKLDVHDLASLEKDTSVPKTDDSAKFGKSLTCKISPGLNHHLKALAISMRPSRPYIIRRLSSNQHKTFHQILFLGSSSIERVSMRKLVGKNMTLATL